MPSPSSPAGRPRRSRGLGENDGAHPGFLLQERPAELEPLLRLRPVARDDVLQLVPVRLAVLPDPIVVLPQLRIRHGQAELPALRHVPVAELLACLLVPLRLAAPGVQRMLLLRGW